MTGGPDMTLFEADLAVNTIKKEVDPNANIIFGSAFNEDMKGKIRISIVATGIDENEFMAARQDDSFKPKSQMVHEIRSTEKTKESVKESEAVNIAMQGRKTFFDPGAIKEPTQDFGRTDQENLEEELFTKPTQNPEEEVNPKFSAKDLYQENLSHEKDEEVVQGKEIKFKQPILNFSDEKDDFEFPVRKEVRRKEVDEEVRRELPKKEIKKEAPKKEEKKKEGFSLFGFMNSGSRNTEEPTTEPDQYSKLNKKQAVMIEDDEDPLPIRMNTKDDSDDNGEDDMLNVPAFFRRKNN